MTGTCFCVEALENEWAACWEVHYAIAAADGLNAPTLALRALDIGPGDEVIVQSNTHIAIWLAVFAMGAWPAPLEPDRLTYNIDPTRIVDALTNRTRAIMPVHLYGKPADLDQILKLARQPDFVVTEDAAQAYGAR